MKNLTKTTRKLKSGAPSRTGNANAGPCSGDDFRANAVNGTEVREYGAGNGLPRSAENTAFSTGERSHENGVNDRKNTVDTVERSHGKERKMLEGVQVSSAGSAKHLSELYDQWLSDMQACGMLSDDLCHVCIWSATGRTPILEARRLAAAGFVILEDSPSGPMVTRTWRGSYALSVLRRPKGTPPNGEGM